MDVRKICSIKLISFELVEKKQTLMTKEQKNAKIEKLPLLFTLDNSKNVVTNKFETSCCI